MDSRCCIQHAIFPINDQERGACDAALHLSQHTKIELLPNVHINEHLELSGFHFEAAGCDLVNVLPIPTNLFDCIVAYEVLNEVTTNFNEKVLHILLNLQEYKTKLAALITELKANTTNVPTFSCMQDDNDDEALKDDELVFCKHVCDRQVWDDQLPRKVGLYSNAYTTCEQLLESEELQWLRSATLRNNNRVAARVADTLGLPVRCFIDTEDPTGHKRSAHPSTVTMKSDITIDLNTRRVHMVDGGCFLQSSVNGILHEMHASEGYWMFCGPPDHCSYNVFGTIFDYPGNMTSFPTSTFRYNDKFAARGTVVLSQHGGESNKDTIFERTEITEICTLFPDESFMRVCEKLGYNRNHSIVSFMPLIQYVSEKAF